MRASIDWRQNSFQRDDINSGTILINPAIDFQGEIFDERISAGEC